MNVRTLIVGTLAIVSGLSAMFLVQALRRPNSGGPIIERSQVIFATADVKPGELIQEGMIEIRDVPKTDIPEDAIVKGADAIDRAAMTTIDKGDMLRQKKLADKGAGRGMNVTIPPGMRAFTITTPSFSSSLAGFILPHNKVDVLLTVNVQGGNENETGGVITSTLLQNVEVIAVHTAISTPSASKFTPEEARSVTLQVTPDDAALLDLGQNKGTLHLTLRNTKDANIVPPTTKSLKDLGPAFARAIPPPPPPVVVEKAPAPPVEPFNFPEPEPEPVEVKLTVRTLRGTSAGQDTLTMVKKVVPRRQISPGMLPGVPTPPVPGTPVSTPGLPPAPNGPKAQPVVGPLAQAEVKTAPGTAQNSPVAGSPR
jgi:pilus assembly protein CpaB